MSCDCSHKICSAQLCSNAEPRCYAPMIVLKRKIPKAAGCQSCLIPYDANEEWTRRPLMPFSIPVNSEVKQKTNKQEIKCAMR